MLSNKVKAILSDNRISLVARAVFACLVDYKETGLTVKHLSLMINASEIEIRRGLRELDKLGYLNNKKMRLNRSFKPRRNVTKTAPNC